MLYIHGYVFSRNLIDKVWDLPLVFVSFECVLGIYLQVCTCVLVCNRKKNNAEIDAWFTFLISKYSFIMEIARSKIRSYKDLNTESWGTT